MFYKHFHSLYLFGADQLLQVWGLKRWDLRGGRCCSRLTGGFWVTIVLRRWGAVTFCLFDFETWGAKHRWLWGLQVVCRSKKAFL